MRLLAIGDIHGCLTAFDTLLDAVQPTPEDYLITLGDYVDRGPDSRGVVERLIELKQSQRLVPLIGNHEQMLLEARQSPTVLESWLGYGGEATMDSYARYERRGELADVPDSHWEFFAGCVDWFETDGHFFVHACASPSTPLAEQPVSWLRWEKFELARPHLSGKVMICGHTRQMSGVPKNLGYAVCIDTWVYGNGWLTCLDANSGRFWQANERGQRREAQIEQIMEPL